MNTVNPVQDLLRWTVAHLAGQERPWALVGGWAVSIRTEPRFTRDVDIAVAVQADAEAEALVASFTTSRFVVDALVEQDVVKRLATVRLRPASVVAPGMFLDLLFASSGIEREVCATSEWLECLPGVTAPVARRDHLLALKILSRDDRRRPQDTGDIRALMQGMTSAELDDVRRLLRFITERGYDRGKSLEEELDRAILDFHAVE